MDGRTWLGEVGHDADGVGDALQPGVDRHRCRHSVGSSHGIHRHRRRGAAVLFGLLLLVVVAAGSSGLHHAHGVAASLLTH
jgi:hypothetical protein